ncbi:MAG: AraC family transcriptional regulator [Bacterioplanes sp.]|nr:AraC family transcriptional regulator [Bacterioplanes sp.]
MIPRPFIDAPLRGVTALGVALDDISSASNIPRSLLQDPSAELNNRQYTQLMSSLWRLSNDELMGLAPQRSRFGTFSMMCKTIIHCATLEHALHRARHFYQLFPGMPRLHIDKQKHLTRLVLTHDLRYDPDHFLSESLLVIWHRLPSWLVGQGIPLIAVGCCYEAPEHASLYQQLFATPVKFNADATYLTIPSKVLRLPIAQNEASLARFLQQSPADLLGRPNPHQSVTGRLRKLLRQYEFNRLPSLTQVAQQLQLSSATLRRRLQDEQTSFQRLKDECRMEEACRLLSRPDHSIRDIAEYLGYTEASTFHRAFKKWGDITPSVYRQQLLQETP